MALKNYWPNPSGAASTKGFGTYGFVPVAGLPSPVIEDVSQPLPLQFSPSFGRTDSPPPESPEPTAIYAAWSSKNANVHTHEESDGHLFVRVGQGAHVKVEFNYYVRTRFDDTPPSLGIGRDYYGAVGPDFSGNYPANRMFADASRPLTARNRWAQFSAELTMDYHPEYGLYVDGNGQHPYSGLPSWLLLEWQMWSSTSGVLYLNGITITVDGHVVPQVRAPIEESDVALGGLAVQGVEGALVLGGVARERDRVLAGAVEGGAKVVLGSPAREYDDVQSGTIKVPTPPVVIAAQRAIEENVALPGVVSFELPEPTPPDPGPSAGIRRWLFQDTVTGARTHVPINPNEMETPTAPRNMDYASGGFAGRLRAIDGPPSSAPTWSFKGVSLTKEHYDLLLAWTKALHILRVTDHLGRTFEIIIQKFDPVERLPTPSKEWRTDYTIECLLLRRVS